MNANQILTRLALSALLLPTQTSTTFAQSTAFTYQGRVRSGGSYFTGPGQFQFALVNSTNNIAGVIVGECPVRFSGFHLMGSGADTR